MSGIVTNFFCFVIKHCSITKEIMESGYQVRQSLMKVQEVT